MANQSPKRIAATKQTFINSQVNYATYTKQLNDKFAEDGKGGQLQPPTKQNPGFKV